MDSRSKIFVSEWIANRLIRWEITLHVCVARSESAETVLAAKQTKSWVNHARASLIENQSSRFSMPPGVREERHGLIINVFMRDFIINLSIMQRSEVKLYVKLGKSPPRCFTLEYVECTHVEGQHPPKWLSRRWHKTADLRNMKCPFIVIPRSAPAWCNSTYSGNSYGSNRSV